VEEEEAEERKVKGTGMGQTVGRSGGMVAGVG